MIDLLYVDEHVVVADKPSGLLVHRGWDNDDDVAMFRVRDQLGGAHVYPLHRLDRGTSGALLFARTKDAAATLARALEAREFEKTYLALVRGVSPEEGVIDYPLPKSDDGPRVAAITHFSPGRRVQRRSLLARARRPHTGRLHQIRRHLRHINHPLVGDVKHGSGVVNRHYRATYDLHRLALHACTLAFPHPVTGARIEVTSPLPADLRVAFDKLGLPS